MPLTSSVMTQSISNFRLFFAQKKFRCCKKKIKFLLEQLQVCIFAEIVFGVRCTLKLCKVEHYKCAGVGCSISFKASPAVKLVL